MTPVTAILASLAGIGVALTIVFVIDALYWRRLLRRAQRDLDEAERKAEEAYARLMKALTQETRPVQKYDPLDMCEHAQYLSEPCLECLAPLLPSTEGES